MPLPAIMAAIALAREFLPGLIGHLTGSKGEAIARTVVDAASEITGLDAATDTDATIAALRTDPAALAAYQSRLLEHAEIIERLGLEDRKDARARDLSLRTALGFFGNLRADVLAIGAFLLLWRIIETITGGSVPASGIERDVLMFLFGVVAKIVGDVYQFEFGSSRGSKDKTRALTGNGAHHE